MNWSIKTAIDAAANSGNQTAAAARILKPEIDRLNNQRCPYCSGYGHSGNDCPTDAKISNLRQGPREQAAIISLLRKQCRE